MSSAKGLTQRGVPAFPPWLLYVKFAILALTVVVFAISCYAASVGWWAVGAAGFLIFVCLKTLIIYGIFLFIELRAPHAYFRIAALILYIFSIIFWLSAWAWSASVAGVWLQYVCYDSFYSTCDAGYRGFGAALAACAGLGAVIWILSIVNLVFFIKASMADPEGSATNPHHQAELGNVKAQEAAAPASYPQQTYPEGHQGQYAQPQQQYEQPQQHYQQPQQQYPQ